MKLLAALLMAMIATVTIRPTQGQVACFKHFTRAEAGTSGGQTFTGITNGTATEDYNNPLYYTLANAQTGLSSPATGRLSGSLAVPGFVGPIRFDFFKKQGFFKCAKNFLTISFTKGTSSGTITGGGGCYKGIVSGTANRTLIGTTVPRVFEWNFCPNKAPSCTPK